MSNSTTIRISKESKKVLEELSKQSGEPMMHVLDKAIDIFQRRMFLEEVNRAYGRLREDAEASKKFDAEMAEWDSTLADGLDEKERWTEKDRIAGNRKREKK